MNMDMNHMQTLGILAQVTHLSSCHAKQMRSEERRVGKECG